MSHPVTKHESKTDKSATDHSQLCFFIAPIGDPDTDVRKRSDQVLRHVIKPAAQSCGLQAKRADEISEPGIITSQVIQHIIEDSVVVADLTGRNPNVFYELAIRHALRKPYAQIIQKGERIPFDVAAIRTIEVDHRDLDSVDTAKEELARQIEAMRQMSRIESPISVAVDLELLRESGNPEQRQLADVLTSVAELKSLVEKKLLDPRSLFPPSYMREILAEMVFIAERTRIPPALVEDLFVSARRLEEALSEIKLEDQKKGMELLELTHRLARASHSLQAEITHSRVTEDFLSRRRPEKA